MMVMNTSSGTVQRNFWKHGRTPVAKTAKCFTAARHTSTARPLTVCRTEPDPLSIRSRTNHGRGSEDTVEDFVRGSEGKRERVTEQDTRQKVISDWILLLSEIEEKQKDARKMQSWPYCYWAGKN